MKQEIGSYSYAYFRFTQLSKEEIINDFNMFEEAIKDILPYRPKVFRPPYGEYNSLVLKEAQKRGHRTVIWTINAHNWFISDHEAIIARIKDRLRGGSIILFYVNDPELPEIISKFIPRLQEKGYRLLTVSSLID